MYKVYMSILEQKVSYGAQLLDEQLPGWESRINLENLEMDSLGFDDSGCILVQLFGGYCKGLRALDIWNEDFSLGFDCKKEDSDYDQWQSYWVNEITSRRNK